MRENCCADLLGRDKQTFDIDQMYEYWPGAAGGNSTQLYILMWHFKYMYKHLKKDNGQWRYLLDSALHTESTHTERSTSCFHSNTKVGQQTSHLYVRVWQQSIISNKQCESFSGKMGSLTTWACRSEEYDTKLNTERQATSFWDSFRHRIRTRSEVWHEKRKDQPLQEDIQVILLYR